MPLLFLISILSGYSFEYLPNLARFDVDHPTDQGVSESGVGYTSGCHYELPHQSLLAFRFDGESNQTIKQFSEAVINGSVLDVDTKTRLWDGVNVGIRGSVMSSDSYSIDIPTDLGGAGSFFYIRTCRWITRNGQPTLIDSKHDLTLGCTLAN